MKLSIAPFTRPWLYFLQEMQCPKSLKNWKGAHGHRGSINDDHIDKSVSNHFNSAGHRIADFSFKVLEKVFKICPEYLRKREE